MTKEASGFGFSDRIGIGIGLLLLAIVFLSAASWLMNLNKSDISEVNVVPVLSEIDGGVEAPAAPDSATGIMRIADIDFGSFSRGLAKVVELELGEPMSSATPKMEAFFAPKGGSVEDASNKTATKTETEFSTFGAEGGKVTLIERVNIRDDSVKAEQFYAIFKAKDEGFILADYGMKIRCHRGDNTTQWQTTLCP